MKMRVWTKQPNYFISQACKLLRARSHGDECDDLLSAQFDGELVSFERLSVSQFCALEDTAVRMGLQYDGSQE